MAATTEASTPRTDSFHVVDRAPRTPTSLPSISAAVYLSSKPSPQLNKALPVGRGSLSPKTPRQGLSPRSSPQPLTGAAALADARRAEQERARSRQVRTSPNPHQVALRALMGSTGMSRASDAPPTTQLSESMERVAEKITVSEGESSGSSSQPTNGSITNIPDRGATTATASNSDAQPQLVEEPESIENGDSVPPHEENPNRPFTYGGSKSVQQHEAARRDMSLPGTGYDRSPKSSSAKRHKCPYCSTDFTRHHNLKSHLLTHSQEKPYVCKTCQSRFRRLHDLKRHEKLHTGERPHTCPKCGRKFARGDALARHNKGPGGCAGRRSSFGNDDEDGDGDGDDTMDGLEYQDEQGSDDRQGESGVFDASGRRVSEPFSRKRAYPDSASAYDSSRVVYRQHSSTYPPPPGRILREQMGGNMGPPQAMMTHQEHPSAESSYSSQLYPPPTGPGYPQMTITDSPKPLSPANQNQNQSQQRLSISEQAGMRGRSPSLNSNSYQFGRPQAHPQATQPHVSLAPQLPSLSGIAPGMQQMSRILPQQAQTTAVMQHQQPQQSGGGHSSATNSHSSHGHSSSGSMRDLLGSDPQEMWNYMRSLEQRFSRMQDEYELRISRLQEDVISLKSQVYQGR